MDELTKSKVIQCYINKKMNPYWQAKAAMICKWGMDITLKQAWILSRAMIFDWKNTPADTSFMDWVEESDNKDSDINPHAFHRQRGHYVGD